MITTDRIKTLWNERIRPAVMIVTVGMLVVFGFRIGELIWPASSSKLMICYYDDIETVTACEAFGPLKEVSK